MLTFLSFALSLPLINSYELIPFRDMLDSAKIVVIGKVDSMWYSVDESNGPWTNISASVIAFYAKDDSLPLPKGSIHIALPGGIRPDSSFVWSEGPSFQKGEVFLSALEKNRWLHSETEIIYDVYFGQCKYTIAKDSVYLHGERPIPLCTAICSLSSSFIQRNAQ